MGKEMISLLYIATKKKETQGTWNTSNPFIHTITSTKQNTALHR
jgi:hypothetical protein